jgi:hypothetical protein
MKMGTTEISARVSRASQALLSPEVKKGEDPELLETPPPAVPGRRLVYSTNWARTWTMR